MHKGNFKELISTSIPTLVYFYADWCGPCKLMAPILSEVKQKVGNRVKILKIDIDRNPQLAHQYQVLGVPTLMLFKQGQLIWRQSGVVPFHQVMQVLLANA